MDIPLRFPCPCCGHLVFAREPGHHETCPICGWEDDLAQLRFAAMPGSSNRVSLQQAQLNYRAFGAAERRSQGLTRGPNGARGSGGGLAAYRPAD